MERECLILTSTKIEDLIMFAEDAEIIENATSLILEEINELQRES